MIVNKCFSPWDYERSQILGVKGFPVMSCFLLFKFIPFASFSSMYICHVIFQTFLAQLSPGASGVILHPSNDHEWPTTYQPKCSCPLGPTASWGFGISHHFWTWLKISHRRAWTCLSPGCQRGWMMWPKTMREFNPIGKILTIGRQEIKGNWVVKLAFSL